MVNCFLLTTLEIMISPADTPLLETLFQNAMICTKLKQLTKGMMRYTILKKFQWIHLASSSSLWVVG